MNDKIIEAHLKEIVRLQQINKQYEVQIGNLFAQVAGLNLALSRMDEHLKKEVRYP